jgi:hypothetical protein
MAYVTGEIRTPFYTGGDLLDEIVLKTYENYNRKLRNRPSGSGCIGSLTTRQTATSINGRQRRPSIRASKTASERAA